MTRRLRELVAGLLTLSCVTLSVFTLFLVQRVHGTLDNADATGSVVLAVSFGVVGGIIVIRRGHLIGWIMLVLSGVFGSLNAVAAEYSAVALEEAWPLRAATAWIAPWVWSLSAPVFPLVLLLFPTGRPPSRKWWPVAAMTACGSLLIAGSGALEAWPLASQPLTGQQIFDRTGEGIYGTLEQIGLALLASSLVLAAMSVGFRYRSATDTERQEVKWLLLGGGVTVAVMFTASPAAPYSLEEAIPLLSYASLLALPAIPVAIGIAITRYHLYDIDVVINRTLVYLVLTTVLALSYLAIVVLLQRALGDFASDSDLAVAGSTLAVAAMFRPLRGRIQSFIDRRFYRSRYDATATLEGFSARLRDEVDLHALKDELLAAAAATMHPSHLSVWLRDPVGVDE